MDAMEFFKNLPRGKEDKPLLFSFGPLEYNCNDVDGLYFMLDRDFSGCLLLNFAKPMNPSINGFATIDGEQVPPCVLKFMPIMGNLWVLGIPLRGFVSEYGRTYKLHVEGYVDEDGNYMNPQDFDVKCCDKVQPEAKYAAHEAVALKAASDGIVLLKNDNELLPLMEGTTLNLFGKGVNQFRTGAVGAGKINPRYTVNLLEAVRNSSVLSINEELVKFYRCDQDAVPPETMLEEARKKSDIAFMLITRGTGENLDNSTARGEYYLSEEEENLLNTLQDIFAHVVVILNVGYPIDVRFASGVDAVIYSGFGGMLAGQALVDVLTGKVNPSGKLPDTWPVDYFDLPAAQNFYDSVNGKRYDADCGVYMDTYYEEGMYVGYRYFSSFGKEVAYPFGFGLSYTTFDVAVGTPVFDGSLHVSITVTNTGKRAGRQVVQIYTKKPESCGETPAKELVWFGKTKDLYPGETETLEAVVSSNYLTVYDVSKAAYVIPGGNYTVFAGTDANAPVAGNFETTEILVKQVSHLMLPPEPPTELTITNPKKSWPQGNRTGVKEDIHSFLPVADRNHYEPAFTGEIPKQKLTFDDVRKNPSCAADFVAQLDVKEMARLAVCASAGWGMEGIGEAGRVFKIEGYDLPDFPVSDGNSGVNLNITNIGMPSGVTMCASFDTELMEEIGSVIGEEAKELGIPLLLAPAMNLHRNPLNGRQPEYFSEDPLVAGVMAGYYCKGLESAGVGSCIKHLVANNCESARKSNQSIIAERTLRELYLKPFEIAMSVQMPASVMTSYNACNGRPTAADEELLMGFLRQENGFNGIVMTDWGTYDTVDVAEMVQAGNCWITPGSLDETFTSLIENGVAEGRIDIDRLRENTVYLVQTMARYA